MRGAERSRLEEEQENGFGGEEARTSCKARDRRKVVKIGRKHYRGSLEAPERKQDKFRVNDRIHWRGDVRVIDEEGRQLGIMDVEEAKEIAEERGLDIVEIVPDGRPPVCRIMNYSKYLYDQEKKEKAAKKNAARNEVKEVKFRCKIADNDLMTKVRSIEKFLQQGSPVRITVMFRGREVTHPELAHNLLQKVLESIQTECSVLKKPEMAGRNMSMTISAKKEQ